MLKKDYRTLIEILGIGVLLVACVVGVFLKCNLLIWISLGLSIASLGVFLIECYHYTKQITDKQYTTIRSLDTITLCTKTEERR